MLDVLEKYQIEILIEQLEQKYPNELDNEIIANLKREILENSRQDFSTLSKEIGELLKGNSQLDSFLAKYHMEAKNKEQLVQKTEQEVKQSLNMQEVTDFTRNGKTYIKITYSDGRTQMIESRNQKNTRQIFEDVQKLKAINNIDGIQNAEQAFQELLKDYVEVPLENNTFLNQEKLTSSQQSKLNFIAINFPNKKILASPEENLFIIEGNPNITVEVTEKDGHYQLRQMGESSYGVKEDEAKEKEINNQEIQMVEQPNDNSFEYTTEQLLEITEGMSEEEIVEYLRLHGKNPSQIMMIVLSLEEERNKKETEKQKEQPKQLVLKNPNNNKIAAFIDSLTLAFLVGVFSGIIFFAMLRIILQFL